MAVNRKDGYRGELSLFFFFLALILQRLRLMSCREGHLCRTVNMSLIEHVWDALDRCIQQLVPVQRRSKGEVLTNTDLDRFVNNI